MVTRDLKQSEKIGVLERIVSRMDTMQGAMARVGRYFSLHPERVINQSIVEVGELTNTGQATIIRFCRLLGFSGFREIKLALLEEIATERSFLTPRSKMANVDIDRLNTSVLSSVQKTAELIADAQLRRISQLIATAGRVDVFGIGVSGICGSLLAFRLLRLGFPVFAVENNRLAYHAAKSLPKDGLAIAISFSGVTEETINFVEAAKSVGASTLAITARQTGQLAQASDMVLPFNAVGPWPMEGSIRFVASFVVVVEAIAAVLSERNDGNMDNLEKVTKNS